MFFKWGALALMCSILGLSVHTWWWAMPRDQAVTGPDYVVIKTLENQIYSFGGLEALKAIRPFGYASKWRDWVHPRDIKPQHRQGQLTRWSENFAVLDTGRSRWFFFSEGFDWAEIRALPVQLHSDIWVLDKVSPMANFPPPKKKIIWLSSEKRLPKAIESLGVETLNSGKVGQLWLTDE